MLIAKYGLEQLGFQRDFGLRSPEYDLSRLRNPLLWSIGQAGGQKRDASERID